MELSDAGTTIQIRQLGGLNERVSPVDLELNQFSILQGLYPSQVGLLSRIPGKSLLFQLDGKVLTIHPTYNSQGHVIIQTDENYYLTTIDEIQNRVYVSNLTSTAITEEENMSLGIIVGYKAAGVNGDVEAAAFAARPLTAIITNDGSFITAIGAINFQLAAGTYRFELMCTHSGNIGVRFLSRLFNSTGSANLLTGNFIESTPGISATLASNTWSFLKGGPVVLAAPTTIEVQSRVSVAAAANVMGKPANLGSNEIYTMLKILKTA